MALLLSKSTRFYCIFECQFPVSLGCGFGHVHSDKIRSLSKRACVFKTNILQTFQGHPTSVFGKYVCCKISCLPASPVIFKHLKNGIIAHFYRIFTLKRSPRIFRRLFSGWNFRKVFWSVSFCFGWAVLVTSISVLSTLRDNLGDSRFGLYLPVSRLEFKICLIIAQVCHFL